MSTTAKRHLARLRSQMAAAAPPAKTMPRGDDDGDDNKHADDAPPHARPPRPRVRGRRQVVTAFVLDRQGRALVVRRSDRVRDYRGLWGGVSGGVDPGDTSLLARALAEVEEEAGLPRASLALVRCGRPLAVDDDADDGDDDGGGGDDGSRARRRRRFLVHPFLFQWTGGGGGGDDASTETPPVVLNWENTEHAFVPSADALRALPHVPLLPETLERLLPPSEDARARLDAIAVDHSAGAAQLALEALAALRAAWAELAPPVAGGGGGGGAAAAAFSESGAEGAAAAAATAAAATAAAAAAALDRWRSYAFLLATARPSMAAVANAVADAVDGALASRPAPAVERELDEAEARCRGGQERAAEAAARAVWRLWESGRDQRRQQQLTVLTLSYSSTIERALLRLAELASAASAAAPNPPPPRLVARVLESRPLFEGVRLARALSVGGSSAGAAAAAAGPAWECEIFTDAQAAVAARGATAMLVGADAVAPEGGGVVNKAGTLPAALACRELAVPVLAAADALKVSPGPVLREGVLGGGGGSGAAGGGQEGEEEEEMSAEEVTAAWGEEAGGAWGGRACVRNVYFEATPLRLVTGGLITGEEEGEAGAGGEGGGGPSSPSLAAEEVARGLAQRRRAQYDRVFGLDP